MRAKKRRVIAVSLTDADWERVLKALREYPNFDGYDFDLTCRLEVEAAMILRLKIERLLKKRR